MTGLCFFRMTYLFMVILDVQDAADQFKESTSERIRFVLKKLREYVNDYKIEHILMKPIQVRL